MHPVDEQVPNISFAKMQWPNSESCHGIHHRDQPEHLPTTNQSHWHVSGVYGRLGREFVPSSSPLR